MKSWIEVSASRLAANFAAVSAVAGPAFTTLAVIKADAYGHGAALCAPVLVEAGAGWLGVSDLEEGVGVRSALAAAGLAARKTRILVMCGFEPEDAAGLVAADLTPVVWTREQVEALGAAALDLGRTVPVHLEIDTGMARQGTTVAGGGFAGFLDGIYGSVTPEGIFSHLCCAEVRDGDRTAEQLRRLDVVWTTLRGSGHAGPWYWHLANSSGVDEGSTMEAVRRRAAQGGAQAMVRPGLALYGYVLPLADEPGALPDRGNGAHLRPLLAPVATWKTRVVGLREIAAGDTVGYGATFVAAAPMRLALLPVGYADGFRRDASSGVGDGWVMIAGQRARVVGRVSMNLTVVDVSAIPDVREGDDAVLLGEGVTAEDHARWCGTIPYEILCGMRGHRRLV